MKIEDIRFIRVGEVLSLHSRSLAKSGGQDGVRDQGLLESAVMAPQTGYKLSEEWIRHIERLAAGELSRDELTALFTAALGGDAIALET